jgi:aminoglycoside phosphotransferase (APT) family kinase protein
MIGKRAYLKLARARIGSPLVTDGQAQGAQPPAGQVRSPQRPQWTAEVEVGPELAAELIREQFPALAASRLALLATGWDNTVFAVDDQWLFRFPRREIAVPGVRREIALLPRLAPSLPLPIPVPRFVGRPTRRYAWPFFGSAMLPGTELADSGLPDPERVAAAAALGRFLRALHDPRQAARPECADLPVDPMRRGNARVRAPRAREVLGRLAAAGTFPADDDVRALLDRAEREPAGDVRPSRADLVVCHGDLHVRHLLVDREGAAVGVIDWGDLCLGDPVVDLAIAYLGFAGTARTAFFAGYGKPIGSGRELAARTFALSLGAYLADYAAEQDRPALLAESVAGLRRAVSPP